MSSDGKCLLAVAHLSSTASAEKYLKNLNIEKSNFYNVYSGAIGGTLGEREFVQKSATDLSKSIYSGNWFADGSIFSSWNYGKTWHLQSGLKPKNWVSCDMSEDGRVQTVVGRGIYKDFFDIDVVENTPTHIYISYDSGINWTPRCSSRTWNSVTISPKGNYLLASDTYLDKNGPDRYFYTEFRPRFKNNIFYSDNSGLGWSVAYPAPLENYYLNTNSGIYSSLNFDQDFGPISSIYNDFSYFGRNQSKLSYDGRYQLIASINGVIVNSNSGSYASTVINPSFVHSRINFINEGGLTTGRLADVFLPLCCDMSNDGRYQIIGGQGFIGQSGQDSISLYDEFTKKFTWFSNTKYGDRFNPDVYFSSNYGRTWRAFPALESGMFCVSASISDDAKYINLLAVPNTSLYLQTRRYGSIYTHSDLSNYPGQYSFNYSDLVYLYSETSGKTWEKQTLNASASNCMTGIYSAPNSVVNQFSFGTSLDKKSEDFKSYDFTNHYANQIFYNYPELEYLNSEYNFSNVLNSKVLSSQDGLRTAILHNGCILLSENFPSSIPHVIPSGSQKITYPESFSNWNEILNSQRLIVDMKIAGSGQYITYIINSGSLLSGQSNLDSDLYQIITYSGELQSGQTHSVQSLSVSKVGGYKGGLIYSSRDSGVTWSEFSTPNFYQSFDYAAGFYGKNSPTASGFLRNNLANIAMSDNGQYQAVFANSIIPSGFDQIQTPDSGLSLYKYKFYTPYFYSSDYGENWITKYFETTSVGLDPSDLHISKDGRTIYLLGNNSGTIYFNDIRSEDKGGRQDRYEINRYRLLPFATDYYRKNISYSIPRVSIPGRALYYTTTTGESWLKLSFLEDTYFSGTNPLLQYSLNSGMLDAINSKAPLGDRVSGYFLPGHEIFTSRLNSFSPSSWTESPSSVSRNSILSIENALPVSTIVQNENVFLGFLPRPHANGYFNWNHESNTFEYTSLLLEDDGNKNPDLLGYPANSGSLIFKEIKVAENNPQYMVAACQSRDYFFARNADLLGNIVKDISRNELRNVFVSQNSGRSWNPVSPIANVKDLNISNDGKHISYLVSDATDIVRWDLNSFLGNRTLLLDEGYRFGVPYVSTNYGNDFHAILKWENDIERRRAAFVGNEYLLTQNNTFVSSLFSNLGGSNSNLLNFAYNKYGVQYHIGLGFTDFGYFYPTGSGFISVIDAAKDGFLDEKYDCKNYSFLDDPYYFTDTHRNQSLRCLRMSPEGQYQVIAQNGSFNSASGLFSGNNYEECYSLSGEDFSNILNSKIYFNDVSGLFQTGQNYYITGSGASAIDRCLSVQKSVILSNPYVELGKLSPNFDVANSTVKHSYLGDPSEKFIYESGALKRMFVVRNNQFISVLTGRPIINSPETLELSNEIENSIIYQDFNLFTTSDNFANTIKYPTSISGDSVYRFPSGIGIRGATNPKLTGVTYETGIFKVKLEHQYLLNDLFNYTQDSYIYLLVSTGEFIEEDSLVSVYSAFESGGTSLIDASINESNFYGDLFNGFVSPDMSGLSGFGPVLLSPGLGATGFGLINNPTGLFNLVSFETGVLSGFVPALNESFTWRDFSVIGFGSSGSVFYDIITGSTQSYNYAIIDEDRLVNDDQIIINDIIFTYKESQSEADSNIFWFNTLDELMTFAAPIALVTGFYDGSILNLYSIIDGDEANKFTLRRDSTDLSAIQIPSIYFTGGQDLRPPASSWPNDYFSGIIPELTIINSGFYSNTGLILDSITLTGSGIVWDAAIAKTVTIESGRSSSTQSPAGSDFVRLDFDEINNVFSGVGVLDSGQSQDYSGIQFRIARELYEPSDTGEFLYIITGKDIYYSESILL
jgi:hypothetical protein